MDARADEGLDVNGYSGPEEVLVKSRPSGPGATITARASMGYDAEAELNISRRVRDPNVTGQILPQTVGQQQTVSASIQLLGLLKLDLHSRRRL